MPGLAGKIVLKEDAMTRLFIAGACIVSLLLFCSSPVVADDDEENLRELVEDGFKALNARDIAAFEKLHVTDETPVHIDAGEGQIHIGWTASKKGFEDFMKMDGKLTNMKNLALYEDDNAGWGVWTFDSTMTMEGKPVTTPMRLTLVFKHKDGKWLVAHSHVSAGLPPMPK